MMSTPLVDVVIPVHSQTRPISRAVSSVLDHTDAAVRVNVVAHNISEKVISDNLGALVNDPRVRLLHLEDGIASPAGPLNFGLDHCTAKFVAVMGSDDEFQAGAIDSWLHVQSEGRADFVIAQIRNVGGGLVPSPPARPRRRFNLDPVKDRLSYRSAPLGLLSREKFPQLRFAANLASGEDLPYVTELWFTGKNIAFDRTGPAYLVHADADDRVTSAPRPISEDFAFLELIFNSTWGKTATKSERSAVGIKMIRGHLFDAVVNRAKSGFITSEREALAHVANYISSWSGGAEKYLSILDHQVFTGILQNSLSTEKMMELISKRWNYRSVDVLVTKNPLRIFHSQAPLRTYIGGYFV